MMVMIHAILTMEMDDGGGDGDNNGDGDDGDGDGDDDDGDGSCNDNTIDLRSADNERDCATTVPSLHVLNLGWLCSSRNLSKRAAIASSEKAGRVEGFKVVGTVSTTLRAGDDNIMVIIS